jgi:hypothetical protein
MPAAAVEVVFGQFLLAAVARGPAGLLQLVSFAAVDSWLWMVAGT